MDVMAGQAGPSTSTDEAVETDINVLPVPLAEVEGLTAGVDENDDREIEFPWDEEARKSRVAPLPIKFQETVVNVDCHPSQNLVACAYIDGDVTVNRFCIEDEEGKSGKHGEELFSYLDYDLACRVVRFDEDGTKVITASANKDLTIHDLETEEVVVTYANAHDAPIYCLSPLTPFIIATGDDDGVVKVWDTRKPDKEIVSMKESEDFISSMINAEEGAKKLVTTSGDGHLVAFNLRQRKVELKSEMLDTELLSMAPIRNRSKLVVGDGNGVCDVFNWNEWGYYADKFPVMEGNSLDCMTAVTDSIVVTAGISGSLKAVHFNPNRLLGEVGCHGDVTGIRTPIDGLALSHCNQIMASCGHDNYVRFWNVAHLHEVDPEKLPKKAKNAMARRQLDPDSKKNAFFADLIGYDKTSNGGEDGEEDESGEDSGDDDDNSEDESDDDDDDSADDVKSKKVQLNDIEEEEEEESDSDSDSPPKKKAK